MINAFKDLEFDAKTILKQLSRIHVAIRRAGTKLRHQRADDTLQNALEEEDFQEWKIDMENFLLEGVKRLHPTLTPPEPLTSLGLRTLSIVQQRLIHANMIRRHRIQVATENSSARRRAVKQQLREAEQQALTVEEAPEPTAPRADEALEKTVKDTKNLKQYINVSTASPHVENKVGSEKESTAQRTATEFPFDYEVDLAPSRRSATIITKATQTGRNQDYPRWPKKLDSDGDILCPYCDEPLAADYVRNDARWRFVESFCAH